LAPSVGGERDVKVGVRVHGVPMVAARRPTRLIGLADLV
jgi:hypothetical protein